MSRAAGAEGLTTGSHGALPPAWAAAARWHPGDMAVRISSPVLVGRAEQLAELDAALAPARRNGPSVDPGGR